MSIISVHRPPVKPTRRTRRPAAPFGAGLFRFTPLAVTVPGFVEPSDEDRRSAALLFADVADGSLEDRALQAAWDARFDDTLPIPGQCQNCGEPCDDPAFAGLCDRCDDAATDASIACQNKRAMGMSRVF